MADKTQITIKIRPSTKDNLELGRIDYIKKTGIVISLAEYIDRLSKKKPDVPKKKASTT